ncbi:hypothetical protein OS493_001595, partial [Desmophyllum pertusum]
KITKTKRSPPRREPTTEIKSTPFKKCENSDFFDVTSNVKLVITNTVCKAFQNYLTSRDYQSQFAAAYNNNKAYDCIVYDEQQPPFLRNLTSQSR